MADHVFEQFMSLFLILRWEYLGFIRQIFTNFQVYVWPSMFLQVFVVIFDFEVGVPWFYLVNLHQFSSLSMVDHVLTVYVIIFYFELGVPGFH